MHRTLKSVEEFFQEFSSSNRAWRGMIQAEHKEKINEFTHDIDAALLGFQVEHEALGAIFGLINVLLD
jgi:hypothetical protein